MLILHPFFFRCAMLATTKAHPAVCARRIIVDAARTSRYIVLVSCVPHAQRHPLLWVLSQNALPSIKT